MHPHVQVSFGNSRVLAGANCATSRTKLIATKVCDLWESIKADIFARDVLVNIQISGLFCSVSNYKGLATRGVLRLRRKMSSEQGARSILGC